MTSSREIDDRCSCVDSLGFMMSVYFNEDVNEQHPTWQSAADDFIARSPDRAAEVPALIDSFLAHHRDDAELDAALMAIGCALDPAAFGSTDRDWLVDLRKHLADRLSGEERA